MSKRKLSKKCVRKKNIKTLKKKYERNVMRGGNDSYTFDLEIYLKDESIEKIKGDFEGDRFIVAGIAPWGGSIQNYLNNTMERVLINDSTFANDKLKTIFEHRYIETDYYDSIKLTKGEYHLVLDNIVKVERPKIHRSKKRSHSRSKLPSSSSSDFEPGYGSSIERRNAEKTVKKWVRRQAKGLQPSPKRRRKSPSRRSGSPSRESPSSKRSRKSPSSKRSRKSPSRRSGSPSRESSSSQPSPKRRRKSPSRRSGSPSRESSSSRGRSRSRSRSKSESSNTRKMKKFQSEKKKLRELIMKRRRSPSPDPDETWAARFKSAFGY
jgi:hypothetical protein